MIGELISYHGGLKRTARIVGEKTGLKLHPQDWVNWRSRNGVTLKYCYIIGKALGISPVALNYYDMKNFYDKDFNWTEEVKKSDLPKSVIEEILSYPELK